jgi:two-component system sensor histidine kinase/response regulator
MVLPDRDGNNIHDDALSRILVVDDQKANCDLLKRTLEPTYHVTSVNSGQAALDLLEKEPFDTVLLDIMLPKMDGLKVLEIIRSTPTTAHLPVILISALSESADIVRGLEMGANDYLTKPSSINVVRARVKTQVTLKRLIDEHKRVIAQLQAAKETRDRFFRLASHDLKAPLANIRMSEYILRDLMGTNPEGKQVLDMMVLTVENMQHVIAEFLDKAPLQSGQVEIKLAAVPVETTIRNVAAQHSAIAAKKNIRIKVGELPGVVMADARYLTQIMDNLASNAVKFSPGGTVITLWSERIENQVRINVADQGPGIPPNERHLLFTECGKLTPRPTGGESSTGLGLWSVKQLVTLQQGEVGVDCPPGGGSTFWITLPSLPFEQS